MNSIDNLNPNGTYSYADYLRWQFDDYVELIRGKLYRMSPAPARRHQEISINIEREIAYYLKEKTCKVYDAPFDVRLPGTVTGNVTTDQIFTVVQPDLCIICDLTKLDDRGCLGAPDLIIEITSPATVKKDLNDKFNLYEAAGVREYWIVFPDSEIASVYLLNTSGQFELVKHFEKQEQIKINILDDLVINLQEVFD